MFDLFTALGQVMLYVDGMNGVINHNETIMWLYSLLSSKVSITVMSSWFTQYLWLMSTLLTI